MTKWMMPSIFTKAPEVLAAQHHQRINNQWVSGNVHGQQMTTTHYFNSLSNHARNISDAVFCVTEKELISAIFTEINLVSLLEISLLPWWHLMVGIWNLIIPRISYFPHCLRRQFILNWSRPLTLISFFHHYA